MGTWRVPNKLTGEIVEVTGPTLQDAVTTYANAHNQAASPPVDPKTGKPGKAPDFVGRAKEALVGAIRGTSGDPAAVGASLQGGASSPGGTLNAIRQGVGAVTEAVAPGSLEELAVQAATLGTPGIGRAVGATGQLAKTAVGIAAPTVAGGIAGATKGDPVGGATLGLTAGTIGEATRLAFAGTGAVLDKVTRRWGNLEMRQYNERTRTQVGPMIARDINADIPSLKSAGIELRGVPDVLKLLDDSTGRQVVGRMFDDVEAKVAKKVGTIDVPRDVLQAAGREDLIAASPGMPKDWERTAARLAPDKRAQLEAELKQAGFFDGPVSVSGEDAIAVAKQLRHAGLRKGEGIAGRPPRVMAEDIQSRIDKALGADKLASEYAQLRDDYSKFMDLRDWLNKNDPSKLFPGMVTRGGATIDLVRFGDAMVKDIADLPPSRFPNLHRTMTGAGSGTRAVEGTQTGLHLGVPVPFTHARLYPGGGAPVPETPSGLVRAAPTGAFTKAGRVAGSVSRYGVAADVPSMNE